MVPLSKDYREFGVKVGNDILRIMLESDPPEWEDAAATCRNYHLGWEKELFCLRQLGEQGRTQIARRSVQRFMDKIDRLVDKILFRPGS